jgi:hypothetical protein
VKPAAHMAAPRRMIKMLNLGDDLRVRGVLKSIFQRSGETTGWVIEVDGTVQIEKQTVTFLEVACEAARCGELRDKRVEAAGRLKSEWGPQRGIRPVLEVKTMREI